MSIYPRKRLGGLSKKIAERKHGTKRALQRYSIHLTRQIRTQIIGKIQHKDGVFIGKISNRMTIWKISTPDCSEVIVVYDKKRKELVTFLPR